MGGRPKMDGKCHNSNTFLKKHIGILKNNPILQKNQQLWERKSS